MFKRPSSANPPVSTQIERVTSVLAEGITWHGRISGRGGLRIEGIFEGEIAMLGMVVVGETGKVTCENVRSNTVIVAGAVHGNITADRLEIRSTGRVWGNVVAAAFTTEEGAFLRGQVTMEDKVDLQIKEAPPLTSEPAEKLSAPEDEQTTQPGADS